MNDELNGQLTSNWLIPAYARDMLWLETPAETVRVEGAHGAFSLSVPAGILTLRWGGENGSALARLRWQVDTLEWDGSVRIGGYIDALHITESLDLPDALTILQVGGQPLNPGVQPYPTFAFRKRVPYDVPSFFDALADDVPESVTTWMALADSPVLVLAQEALVAKMRVHCFGSLADENAGWHEAFALPIVLEAMTLFPT